MQINGRVSGDWGCRGIKYDPSTKTRTFVATLTAALTDSEVGELFGSEMVSLAFSTRLPALDERDEGPLAYRSIAPAARFEAHTVRLLSVRGDILVGDMRTIPEVAKIQPHETDPAYVTLTIVMPIDLPLGSIGKGQVASLAMAVGELVDVGIEPVQLSLGLDGKPDEPVKPKRGRPRTTEQDAPDPGDFLEPQV